MTTATERSHAEALIKRGAAEVQTALDVARRYGLTEAAERCSWALDFLADGAERAKVETGAA